MFRLVAFFSIEGFLIIYDSLMKGALERELVIFQRQFTLSSSWVRISGDSLGYSYRPGLGKDMELWVIGRLLRELPRQLVKGAVQLQTASAVSTTQDCGKMPRSFGWRNFRDTEVWGKTWRSQPLHTRSHLNRTFLSSSKLPSPLPDKWRWCIYVLLSRGAKE